MKNFEKKLEEATEEELHSWVNTRNPHFTVLASNELIRRALNKLHGVIRTFNEQSSKQTEKMIALTQVIIFLTGVLVVGLFVQIYLAKIQVSPILSEQQRNERRAYEFCVGYPGGDWPSATGGQVSCTEVLKILEGKFK